MIVLPNLTMESQIPIGISIRMKNISSHLVAAP